MKEKEFWRLEIGTGTVKYLTGTGPVELMQVATKDAGMVIDYPKQGDYYFDFIQKKWTLWGILIPSRELHPVIPAPEPEPEKPCKNCQNAHSWQEVIKTPSPESFMPLKTGWMCPQCRRRESEWTYAKKEEKKPCKNCQNALNWSYIVKRPVNDGKPLTVECAGCGRPESEWTYAPDERYEIGVGV
jgi:hypothetical protein